MASAAKTKPAAGDIAAWVKELIGTLFPDNIAGKLLENGINTVGQLLLVTRGKLQKVLTDKQDLQEAHHLLTEQGLRLFNPHDVGDAREALLCVYGSPGNIPIGFVLKHGVPIGWISDIRKQGIKTLNDVVRTGGWGNFLQEQGIINPIVRQLLAGLFLIFANDLRRA